MYNLIIVAGFISIVELTALLSGVDGLALAAYSGAMGAIFGGLGASLRKKK